jgi:preprotein translocase subunit YajC
MLGQINSQYILLAYVLLLAAIFYVMVIVPQRRRSRERQQLIKDLKVKDEIVTIGGVYGTITAIHEDIVLLKVDEKTTIRVAKDAIGALVKAKEDTKKANVK